MNNVIIRKATAEDIPAIAAIYDEIHTREEAGEVTTGWLRGVYPVQKTAEDAVARGDMYVQVVSGDDAAGSDSVVADGRVVGTAILNQLQVDVYADGEWQYPAEDSEVMVIHTLIISRKTDLKGLGSDFLAYYEAFALEHGCKYLRLDTNARNAAARAFYKRHGYTEIGIVPTVFNGIPGVDLVLIEKKLG
ncbi:MAG: GNAT family N-acetyltransferase [Clostridiales bacterium]|nr:GNAT family N-acetyltransferase [Clostridiales bacterium]